MTPNNIEQPVEEEKPPKKRSLWGAVLLVAIVILIIIAAGYYFLDREWRGRTFTYENSRFGYSVEYPIDWTLGEAPTNNDGRNISSDKDEVLCSIFGFTNSLTSESGGPQSLEEYIDWMLSDDEIDLIEKSDAEIDQADAKYLHYISMGSVMEAVYTLNKEDGLGFWCSYQNDTIRNKYSKTFITMSESIKLEVSGSVEFGGSSCETYLSGVSIPLIDTNTFVDTTYTEVTLIDSDSWDREKLPAEVIENEENGYTCYPTPLEFNSEESGGDELSQPEVTKVEWQCELEYEDFRYIETDDTGKESLVSSGFSCESISCDKDDKDNSILLCTK